MKYPKILTRVKIPRFRQQKYRVFEKPQNSDVEILGFFKKPVLLTSKVRGFWKVPKYRRSNFSIETVFISLFLSFPFSFLFLPFSFFLVFFPFPFSLSFLSFPLFPFLCFPLFCPSRFFSPLPDFRLPAPYWLRPCFFCIM